MPIRSELGSNFYLWSAAGWKGLNRKLLIASHGSEVLGRKSIPIPFDASCKFAGPASTALMDVSTFQYFRKGGFVPIESAYGVTENYVFEKLQKKKAQKDGFDETYASIARIGDMRMAELSTDIVTVRNRAVSFLSSPTLEDLFYELVKGNHKYDEFICAFCRSSLNPFSRRVYTANYR
jgi:hypothetical protein